MSLPTLFFFALLGLAPVSYAQEDLIKGDELAAAKELCVALYQAKWEGINRYGFRYFYRSCHSQDLANNYINKYASAGNLQADSWLIPASANAPIADEDLAAEDKHPYFMSFENGPKDFAAAICQRVLTQEAPSRIVEDATSGKKTFTFSRKNKFEDELIYPSQKVSVQMTTKKSEELMIVYVNKGSAYREGHYGRFALRQSLTKCGNSHKSSLLRAIYDGAF